MDAQDERDGMSWMMGTGMAQPIKPILSIHASSPVLRKGGAPHAGGWAGDLGSNWGNHTKLI